jgi:hypothetical protein
LKQQAEKEDDSRPLEQAMHFENHSGQAQDIQTGPTK